MPIQPVPGSGPTVAYEASCHNYAAPERVLNKNTLRFGTPNFR
jgi:hypothetical protein